MDGIPRENAAHRRNPPLIDDSLSRGRVDLILTPAEMRRLIAILVMLGLGSSEAVAAPRNSWNKIRYRGGTVHVRVDPWDWNTTLTVRPDSIVLLFSPRTTLKIKPSQVRSISYGEEAHRRVENIVALGVLIGPLALFGLFHVSRDQLAGIVYDTEDGKSGAVLLETPFALTILQALKEVTGKPIEVKP